MKMRAAVMVATKTPKPYSQSCPIEVVEIDLERKRVVLSMRSEESAEEKTARVERAKEGGENTEKKQRAKVRPQKKKLQQCAQKVAPPSKPDTAFSDALRQAGLKGK